MIDAYNQLRTYKLSVQSMYSTKIRSETRRKGLKLIQTLYQLLDLIRNLNMGIT